METNTFQLKAVYKEGNLDTFGKAYSACRMEFSPHSGYDWVFGQTEQVKAYFESLTCSFDFNWFLFDSEENMLESMKEVEADKLVYLYSKFYPVDACSMGEEPKTKTAIQPSII